MKNFELFFSAGRTEFLFGSKDLYCDLAGRRKSLIVTDENVFEFYSSFIGEFNHIVLPPGEKHKNFQNVEKIIEKLIRLRADRSWRICGVGGGVICDMAGFAASIFMRGINFRLLPTSLIAQADASIGGKTGVNLSGFKNMAGTFFQPEFIVFDTSFLSSLPKDELISGFAEVIKTALIADESLFHYLEKNHKSALDLDKRTINEIISKCVKIKSSIVQEDERETGKRMILNFGHTIGHAVESVYGLKHGDSIAIGMIRALRISERLGFNVEDILQRTEKLLNDFNLPVEFDFDIDPVFNKIAMDKKRHDERLHYILLEKAGNPVTMHFTIDELRKLCYDLR